MKQNISQTLDGIFTGPGFEKRIRNRNFKNALASSGIRIGGVLVIASVLLIMFFLVYVVVPLFSSATVSLDSQFKTPGNVANKTLYYGVDEYRESGMRFTDKGELIGFELATGKVKSESSLPIGDATVTSFNIVNEAENILAFGLSSGSVLIAQYGYKVTYPDDVKTISPFVKFPFGEVLIDLADNAIEHLAVRMDDDNVVIAFKERLSKTITVKRFTKESSMFGEGATLEEEVEGTLSTTLVADHLLLDGSMRNLYIVQNTGEAEFYTLADLERPKLVQALNVLPNRSSGNSKITSLRFLLGETSLLVGTNHGEITQWFPVRDAESDFYLQSIRTFKATDKSIEMIAIEHSRRGFSTIDSAGQFDLFHSTSERHLSSFVADEHGVSFVTFSPRANGALIETKSGQILNYHIENEYPDVSFSSLWGKVWYEGYAEPSYTWQSSSASSDFESKFSMVPLTFGTIKAALYSMLFAVPIAVLAAIYTAFFMDAKTRQWIKPSVELIEALPTVILGFLAGLWLAPFMESNLPGFFAILIVVPLGIVLFGFLWSKLPDSIRLRVAEGKRSLLMIPVIIGLGYLALAMNHPIENIFFDGNMRQWLTVSAGVDFDQRNAMVIGFAMGFALIPTIFSVAEDAIYNVPRYLVNGSLALGASSWQTMVGVVLPTASPGIFSAIMLGFGRGIGETMIVLMASGNTPLMEVNIFEGMRTLAANLAVEMSEAEVYSSHYRVLFLSGLVLFLFTFFFNTLAEIVRERMRRRYGSL